MLNDFVLAVVLLGLETWKTTMSSPQRRAEPRGRFLGCGVCNVTVSGGVLGPLPGPDCRCFLSLQI